jgi:hypothetical protein
VCLRKTDLSVQEADLFFVVLMAKKNHIVTQQDADNKDGLYTNRRVLASQLVSPC